MPVASYLVIKAGTQPSSCRSCRQRIFWILHPRTNRRHPVSVAVEGALPPGRDTDGRGISHFADCPNAEHHRSKR